jgi:hypothetical protein
VAQVSDAGVAAVASAIALSLSSNGHDKEVKYCRINDIRANCDKTEFFF